MKKILFVSATLETGGVQYILSLLSKQLSKNYDITILLNDVGRKEYDHGGRIITLGMKSQNNRNSVLYQLKVFFKRYFKLRSLKKNNKYDICVSMLDSANVANILSGRKYCKVITTIYTNITASKLKKPIKFVLGQTIKLLYNKSDKIIIASKGVKKDLEQHYRLKADRMQVIYDGVDIENIKEKANEKIDLNEKFIPNKRIITNLGRLDNAKAQWHLIRAMKKVRLKMSDAVLLVMGRGALKEKLEQLVNECDLKCSPCQGHF